MDSLLSDQDEYPNKYKRICLLTVSVFIPKHIFITICARFLYYFCLCKSFKELFLSASLETAFLV